MPLCASATADSTPGDSPELILDARRQLGAGNGLIVSPSVESVFQLSLGRQSAPPAVARRAGRSRLLAAARDGYDTVLKNLSAFS